MTYFLSELHYCRLSINWFWHFCLSVKHYFHYNNSLWRSREEELLCFQQILVLHIAYVQKVLHFHPRALLFYAGWLLPVSVNIDNEVECKFADCINIVCTYVRTPRLLVRVYSALNRRIIKLGVNTNKEVGYETCPRNPVSEQRLERKK